MTYPIFLPLRSWAQVALMAGSATLILVAFPSSALDLVTTKAGEEQWEGSIWGFCTSEDGNLVAFGSDVDLLPEDTNGLRDVYLKDRTTRELFLISKTSSAIGGNGNSDTPGMSADGNLIVFTSQASNLVPGDMNGSSDVFLYNRTLDTTTRISVDASGIEVDGQSFGADISADGSRVIFTCNAPLVGTDMNERFDIFSGWCRTRRRCGW